MNIGTTPVLLACLLLAAHGSRHCNDKAKTTPLKLQDKQTRAVRRVELETELKNVQSKYNERCKRIEKLCGKLVELERKKYKLILKIAQKAQDNESVQNDVLAQAHKGRYSEVNSVDDAMREVIKKHREELCMQSMLLGEIERLKHMLDDKSLQK